MGCLRRPGASRPRTPILLSLALLGVTAQAQAQEGGRITASVNPQRVEAGQPFDYTLKILSDGQATLRLTQRPDFGDAFRIQGTSQGTEFRSVNGRSELTQSVRFRVIALREGTFTLQGAQAEIGGKLVEPAPVKITVYPPGKAPEPPPGTPRADEPITLRMSATTLKPWVGQLVLLEYALFIDEERISPLGLEVRSLQEPPFDGFWIEDLTEYVRDGRRRQTLQGRDYLVRTARLQAIFPLKPGPQEIQPVQMDVEAGSFGMFRARGAKLASEPLTLDVQPLPAGAPPGFDPSNVGAYVLEVEAEQRKVRVNEPITLRVTVRGAGYVGRVELPALPPLPGVRTLDPVIDRQLRRTATTVGGAKTAEIVLIPTQTGVVTIPALRFPFFNPDKGAYEVATSEPLQIAVAGVAQRPVEQEVDVTTRNDADQPPEALQIAALPLRPLRDLPDDPAPLPPDTRLPWLLLLLGALLPPGAYAALLLLRRARAHTAQRAHEAPSPKAALQDARKRLQIARDAPSPQAWAELEALLADAAAPLLDLPPARLTGDRLLRALRERGAPQHALDRLARLQRDASQARFAGTPAPPEPSHFEDAARLLDSLQELR